MKGIIHLALRLRWVVVLLSVFLLVVGVQVVRNSPMDVFPEFSPILVEVQTEAPGLSSLEVEKLITLPIEYALNGVKDMETIRSKSVQGLSSVVVIFQTHSDLMEARQLVQERLLPLQSQLPSTARPPVMLPPLSSLSRIMKIGVSSDKYSQMELTSLIRWTIRPKLMSIPGVANIALWGQRDKQFQILIDPDLMKNYQITLDGLIRTTQSATALSGGGFLETPNQRIAVSHTTSLNSIEDFKKVPVAFRFGTALSLDKVATIKEGHQIPIGDAVINDKPGLLLIVEKQVGANTLEVTKNVEAEIEKFKPNLKNIDVDTTIFRPASFIEMSLKNLGNALIWGCILVAIILFIFLNEWRVALISLTAIPLSLITAALVLHSLGLTMNTMVIAGLAIALGEVVDDAIIDVENVLRRLKLNKSESNPLPPWKVILEASLEVRSAVVYATIIVVLVFLPIFFLGGISGTFFRPLAISYILAVSASLFVALILTPALSLILLPKSIDKFNKQESRWVTKFKESYGTILLKIVEYPKYVISILAVLFLITISSIPFLGEEFLPQFKENDFLMHWVAKPGTSLEAVVRTTEKVSKELRSIPGVRNFGSHIGRAEAADEVVGTNFAEHWISIDPNAPYESTVKKIQQVIDGYPGLYRDVLTYLKERIKEVVSGGSGTIVVRLYGPNLYELREKAQSIKKEMSSVKGASQLQIEQQVDVPGIEISIKPEAAAQFGVNAGDVRKAASTMIAGLKVGEVVEDQKFIDVVLWSGEDTRNSLKKIGSILIDTVMGGKVPLSSVANIKIVGQPNVIQHENSSRKIDISCNAKGNDLGSVAKDIENKLQRMNLGNEYHAEIFGEYIERQKSQKRLIWLSLLALAGILIVIFSDFKSIRLTLLIFISLPFALVGGVVSSFISGGILSLGSLVGFVTVIGIAARNGIMLISHYRHLQIYEGKKFGTNLIILGSQERIIPILMTAASTALALLPIVVEGNVAGHEIEYPMAMIIIAGLFTSTILNLFVMPVLSLNFAKSFDRDE